MEKKLDKNLTNISTMQSFENPLTCAISTFRSTGLILKMCDKIYDFDKISLLFKCLNLASKTRNFYTQILVSIGLAKEMRMLGKITFKTNIQTWKNVRPHYVALKYAKNIAILVHLT